MTHPAPDPVQDFFARYLANPNADGVQDFYIKLLDLELRRATCNVLSDPPLIEPSAWYRADISKANRALDFARRGRTRDLCKLELRHSWLTLLGYRLSFERGLVIQGVTALAVAAATRLDLPLKETVTWSEDRLFHQYTQTVLRDEWDYPGLRFRYQSPAGMAMQTEDP